MKQIKLLIGITLFSFIAGNLYENNLTRAKTHGTTFTAK